MAVNKNNVRMYLTFTKKQANWIRNCAKKCNLQISDFVKWLIDKNLGRYFAKMDNFEKQIIQNIEQENKNYTPEEIDKIFDTLGKYQKETNDDEEIPF